MKKNVIALVALFVSVLGVSLAQNAPVKKDCPPCGGDKAHCYAVLPPGPPARKTAKKASLPPAVSAPAPMPAALMQCCMSIPEKPLQTWADSEKEKADTDEQRLGQVEVPAQGTNQFRAETERMLAFAQIEAIRANARLTEAKATTEEGLLPLRKNAMAADANLTNMRAGYLKHDHLWQLLDHMVDATGFSMGMAYQNVAGINVSQQGGGASVSNAGNVTAKADGGNASSSSSSASQSQSKSESSSSSSSVSSSKSDSGASASAASTGPALPPPDKDAH